MALTTDPVEAAWAAYDAKLAEIAEAIEAALLEIGAKVESDDDDLLRLVGLSGARVTQGLLEKKTPELAVIVAARARAMVYLAVARAMPPGLPESFAADCARVTRDLRQPCCEPHFMAGVAGITKSRTGYDLTIEVVRLLDALSQAIAARELGGPL